MEHWLYPSNVKYYDVLGTFKESETYWPMNSKVEAGDVIYIYLAAPHKQIGFVCDVLKIDLSEGSVLEKVRPFMKGEGDGKEKTKPFLKLRPSHSIDLQKDSLLGLSYLKENGLNGMLMGPRKLENNPALLTYIQEVPK